MADLYLKFKHRVEIGASNRL